MKTAVAPLFLLGATGVGKSAAALELARTHPRFKGAAILAVDAMQVYRGADVGTSKPNAAERAEFPHGGLDLAEFGESFDVARYVEHAAHFLREQREKENPVIAVGGTGLYFRALTRGLCEAPRGSAELRAELAALSVEDLRVRLEKADQEMLKQVDGGNPRRLSRAIEVMESTGRSLRAWQEKKTEPVVADFTAFWLQREKKELERLLSARVEAMFSSGWVEEVRGLMARHGEEAVRAFPAIGYRQVADLLAGRLSLEAAKSDILVATRQYAKRQLTWFSREPTLRKVMLSGSLSADLPPFA
jgi:tRNA dimethylallyltransferase